MSTAALMLVRDEADIIGYTLTWLQGQVDHVYVMDNRSVDATPEIAAGFANVTLIHDPEIGYWQAKKTTRLADLARQDGHEWVVPCDADERWEAQDGRTVADFLAGVPLDTPITAALLYNYLPTGSDNMEESNPFARIGWRQASHAPLPKVACRTWPGLRIEAGNHGATYGDSRRGLRGGGLIVRHYTWRDEDQYVLKIRNGAEAYAQTTLDPRIGVHWRMWDDATDDEIRAHFREHFFVEHPVDYGLVWDPAE